MKRFALRLPLFLFFGAVVNIAVAWGVVFMHDPALSDGIEESCSRDEDIKLDYMNWYIARRAVRGSELIVSSWMGEANGSIGLLRSSGDPEAMVPNWAPELSPSYIPPEGGSTTVAVARMNGWPALTLRGRIMYTRRLEFRDGDAVFKLERSVRSAVVTQSLPSNSLTPEELRCFPTGPIWPGFAINTVFYAAILWLPFVAFGRIRRRRRIKRGLCARCAYPVSASGGAVCSECGSPVHGAAAPCNPCPNSREPTADSSS